MFHHQYVMIHFKLRVIFKVLNAIFLHNIVTYDITSLLFRWLVLNIKAQKSSEYFFSHRILLLSEAGSWQEESPEFTFKHLGLKLDLSSLLLLNLSAAVSRGHMRCGHPVRCPCTVMLTADMEGNCTSPCERGKRNKERES